MTESTIYSVTLNPSIDVPIALDAVHLGETNRCISTTVEPGGKALNASRVIKRLGGSTIAYGFIGGITGALLQRRLDDEGVPHAFDEIDGLTRLDVMVFERTNQRRTRLLPSGPTLDAANIERLRRRLESVPPGSVVVLGGSVPPGLPIDVYRDLVAWLDARSIRCIVDTSGPALAMVLAARPAFVKPNEEEAAEILGSPVRSDEDALEAARVLQRRGARAVVVSQGERGAIAVDSTAAWKVEVPIVDVCSTVGSGDSMVGGLALALSRNAALSEALRVGAAAGTATACSPGRNLCQPADFASILPRIVVRELASAKAAL